MRLLAKHGAEPRFVLRSEYVTDDHQQRSERVTTLMAALGVSRGQLWVSPPIKDREALTLEAARVAVDLGADLNASNTDGRTALDRAKELGHPAVVGFLTDKGAKPGRVSPRSPSR
jgi:ankyrin repeat protein